ncbi:hypothetical protein [Brumimicrobium mesophilum]|uniref:hypothetical protein n=1 Tax=Brumimicrobium mesophilum TaxID=392717 RepID=UPI00131E2DCC|nr:hypothetical protein [Brumimicrobium mesophilum]
MKTNLSILFTFALILFSCNKDEQSCSDGIFTPEKEEKLDCGGVCPPCDFVPTIIDTYLSAEINDQQISFNNFSLSKTPDWIFSFDNDTISVNVNFGSGDSLGGRPISTTFSIGELNNINYSTLHSGFVAFEEINDVENYLSGIFTAKFISDINVFDTLVIKGAQFAKINW